jgi:protein tyrosine phosphatase (PTP) superfamily phosphohydrolase (DUF442 family)
VQLVQLQHFLHRFSSRYTTGLMRRRIFFLAIFCGVVSSPPRQEQPGAPAIHSAAIDPAYGEKLQIRGIPNAGKINDALYRGAQPKQAGLVELKKLGITTIVDLRRDDPQKADWEGREAAALGLRFVYIPIGGWKPPREEQVAEFLELFRNDPKARVFIHCRFGDDRTGLFVAIYRLAVDQWTTKQAIGEMYFFGFNGFWHPSMKRFIREFPEHMRSSSVLAPLAHASSH